MADHNAKNQILSQVHSKAMSNSSGWRHHLLYAAALCGSAVVGTVMAASPVFAQSASNQTTISLDSKVFVMRSELSADGTETVSLKEPKDVLVVPGDRLKFILTYDNKTGQDVTGFKATNPMPNAVQYTEVAEDWAEVSIDGGKNWGELTDLTVVTKDEAGSVSATRNATTEDVTHVRWVFKDTIVKNEKGSVSFNGVVK